MSNKLPVVSGRRMVKLLESRGMRQVRRHGSHIILSDEGGDEIVVPDHKELRPGTTRGILRDARISREEFICAIRPH